MTTLRFRAPGSMLSLGALLARSGAADEALARALRGGSVRVDGRVTRESKAQVLPGARVEVRLEGDASRPASDPVLRHAGEEAAVVEAEAGTPADALGALLGWEAAELRTVFAGGGAPRGLRLLARNEAAEKRLRAALSADAAAREERTLVATPPWRRGALQVEGAPDASLRFEIVAEREGVAELRLLAGALDAALLREALARAFGGALGDARFGGRLVAGGLRLWSHRLVLPAEGISLSFAPEADPWPGEPVFPQEASPGAPEAELAVSRATLRAIGKGHPWVLADSETGDPGRFRAGGLVRLRGPGGASATLARVEGEGALAARVWAVGEGRRAASVESRVATALARRRGLLAAADTDVYRLVHGEADGLPGLFVDRLGGCLRMVLAGRACAPLTGRILDALVRSLSGALGADPPVVEVIHLRERPAGRLECVRLARGALPASASPDGSALEVRERGLVFSVDPGLAAPERPGPAFGLFPDQRENRARLAAHASGGRWLNLFAHTGAFSVALLAAGAAEVVSVDLSAAWLRRLDEAVARNGLDPARSRCLRGDARRVLERLAPEERFDGIVLDPPTAAAAGRRFWAIRRDLEPLLEAAFARLAPKGRLLVCRNDRAGGRTLEALVRRAAGKAGAALSSVAEAPPGEDYPRLAGFPEGDPFEGVLVVRE